MIRARATEPPSGVRRRSWPWVRGLLVSVACLVSGAVCFFALLGLDLQMPGNTSSVPFVLMVFLDAFVGVAASIACGPMRRSRVGNVLIVVAGVVSSWAVPATVVSLVRIGSRRSTPLDVLVVGIAATGSLGITVARDLALERPSEDLVLIPVIAAASTVLLLLWGRVRGTRAALVDALRGQAASAEEAHRATVLTREAEVARARAEERSAIARDMHDGISHQLAIVAMHAGALSYRDDLDPERRRAAASTVREAASDASSMLRDALTALRATDGDASRVPLPDTAAIESIVENTRAAGHTVQLDWVGMTAEDLDHPPGRGATCARILEELLMNARKYAPSAPVSVRIERASDGLVLRVANPLAEASSVAADTTGTGLGLVGVAERAAILGGSARFGPTPAGSFEVEVRLP